MRPIEGARMVLRALGKVLHALLRVLGWAFLVVVLLAAGLGGYAYRRFSSEDAKRLAAQELTMLLNREVTIDRLVLAPRGLKVLGLRVRRGRAGGDADLLVCGSALATIKLRPLLDRRVEFETVILRSPQISLARDSEGHWDLSDVFGSSTPAGARPAGAPLPIALASAETVVEDGVLRIDDRLRGRRIELKKLSLKVTGFDPDRPFPLQAKFTTSETIGGRSLTASVSASGRVDLAGLRWSSASATADQFRIDLNGLTLRGRATATGFVVPRVEADVSASPVGAGQWRSLLGRDVPLSLPATHWRLRGSLPAAGMLDLEKAAVETPAGGGSLTGLFDFAAATPTMSVEASAAGADLAAAASWAPGLARFALSGRATVRLAVTGWPGRLQPRDGELALRDFGARWDGRRIEDADIDASMGDEFSRIKAAISKGKIAAVGNNFTDLAGSLAADGKNLTVERLGFKWGGSRVRLRARFALERGKDKATRLKQVELSGNVDKVDWLAAARLAADVRAAISTRTVSETASAEPRPWLRAFKYSIPRGFPDTVGHVRVGEVSHPNFSCKDVELLWSLRNVTPALDKVSGEARLSFGPGRVADIPAVQDANKFLRVVFLPFIFMHKMNNLSVFSATTAYPKSLDFSRIDGEYGASRGVATTRYFHVDSQQLVAYAEGTADFAREKVDMNILTRLGGYRGSLPEWWVDEAGRPAIGFRVKGDINRPELEPRFKKIGEDEIERNVEGGRARAKKRFEALERLQTF